MRPRRASAAETPKKGHFPEGLILKVNFLTKIKKAKGRKLILLFSINADCQLYG